MSSASKKIIVTGSASGLGALILETLRDAGFDAFGFDHKMGDDVRFPERTMVSGEELYALINCAGVNKISWLEDLTEESWDETLGANAYGMVRMAQHFLPALRAAKGTILNIVSNASHMPMRGSVAYNASKAAAHIITLQMARELYGRHGVTVFGISPNRLAGTAMSNSIDEQVTIQRGWTLEEAQKYQRASLPIGEETDPAQLAEFIGFLLSTKERHKYLHGCVLPYGA